MTFHVFCVFLHPQSNKKEIMAIYIKAIPTLKGTVAERFNEQAAKAETKRGSVDFSAQIEKARRILATANL